MTDFRIDFVTFDHAGMEVLADLDHKHTNWPVVYTLNNDKAVYVGETTRALGRLRQHLDDPRKQSVTFTHARVIVDDWFNKSACLDLEAHLVRLFHGDGKYRVENRNAGQVDQDYYQRSTYESRFESIFNKLRAEGLFNQSRAEIENSALFKLSPFKALNDDQTEAVKAVVAQLLTDLKGERTSMSVVRGAPGTGKTVVGIFLVKLLMDIKQFDEDVDAEIAPDFVEFFTPENAAALKNLKVALVVPQQSLRKTVQRVFMQTSGLRMDMVLTPFNVGESSQGFDLLIVDEAHRLQQLASTMPMLIKKFKSINQALFGGNEAGGTQLDWIRLKSRHQLFLTDAGQSVRPADVPTAALNALESEAGSHQRLFTLSAQMRVRADEDYVGYVRAMLSPEPPQPTRFADYDLQLFDDVREIRRAIIERDAEFGLSRMVAGYAWEWKSKNDLTTFDIEIDGEKMRWNSTDTNWVNSPTSLDEVGSIHTIQGYDLNYAGVIIGPDLRYDPEAERLYVVRESYFDAKGKQNNRMLGLTYSDDDLLRYITNIYAVLLTRGIRGTYVYACDANLAVYLADLLPSPK